MGWGGTATQPSPPSGNAPHHEHRLLRINRKGSRHGRPSRSRRGDSRTSGRSPCHTWSPKQAELCQWPLRGILGADRQTDRQTDMEAQAPGKGCKGRIRTFYSALEPQHPVGLLFMFTEWMRGWMYIHGYESPGAYGCRKECSHRQPSPSPSPPPPPSPHTARNKPSNVYLV